MNNLPIQTVKDKSKMGNSFFDKVRQLIQQAKTKKALQELLGFCERENLSEYFDDSSNLINQLAKLDRKNMLGIISSNEYSAKSNKITYSTISLVREIETGSKVVQMSDDQFNRIQEISKIKEKNISNKLKSIAWLERGLYCSSSVCLILVRKKNNFGDAYFSTGTGFLIRTNLGILALTNHHVINDVDDLSKTILVFRHEKGMNNNIEKKSEYKPDLKHFITNEKLDYSLFSVLETENKPKMNDWRPLKLVDDIRANHIEKGEHVTIVQHPHGQFKQIALNENRITEVNDKDVFYLTDTDHGSSGSPVFNDNWEVIALHWGHRIVKTKREKNYYNNGGTLILKIKEDLAEKGIKLLQPVEK